MLAVSVVGAASPGRSATAGTGPRQVVDVYHAPRGGEGGNLDFVPVGSEMGVEAALRGMRVHATASGDVNGDGWTDLFVGSFADRPPPDYAVRGASGPAPDRLLLGGPGGFRIDETFPAEHARTAGATLADLDADGDLDLALARNVRARARGDAPSRILRNDAGHFVHAAVLDRPQGARAVGVLDADRDGHLDLVVVEDRFSGGSSVLFRNLGELRFVDVTARAGLPDDVAGFGVATADLNGDGVEDLFVSGSNRLFVGEGRARFREVDLGSRFEWPRFGDEDDPAGVAVGDVDADGRPDLVIGQHYNSTVDFGARAPVRLYLNRGTSADGTPRFRGVTKPAGLRPLGTKAPHVAVVDLDADGRLDILTSASTGVAPVVFRQTGVRGGVPRFEQVGVTAGPHYWVTAALLDVDRDGRIDVFLAEWEPSRPSVLVRNEADTGHWFGVSANPGVVVELFRAGRLGRLQALIAQQTLGTSTGFAAGPATTAWFGLGVRTRVDVRITGGPLESIVVLRGARVDRLVRLE